jgi:hypothetical protein
MTDIDTATHRAALAYAASKMALCAVKGGPTHGTPMLEIQLQDGMRRIVSIGDVSELEMVGRLVLALLGETPTQILFMAEGVWRDVPDDVSDLDAMAGTVIADYQAGRFDGIEEVLHVAGIDVATRKVVSYFTTWRYDDHGQPVYDQPERSDVNGPVPQALRSLADAATATAT